MPIPNPLTAALAATTVDVWGREHPEFAIGTNEAGMRLGEDSRGADAAIWRRAELGGNRGKFRHLPPVLAVEVSGQDETEPALREKAHWYLAAGVQVVWLVLADEREVVVITPAGEHRFGAGDRIPEYPALPGLAPNVADLFRQISAHSS
jgi:Uma2 family endonuclease